MGSMLIPLGVCVLISISMLGFYASKYEEITHNLNVGSKFSLDFKESLDLKMYHYAVGSRDQKDLPVEDVESAIALAESLRETTYLKESRQCIQDIIDYCGNLERKMYLMAETKEYDSRQTQLDNNIYVLTNLIQGRMLDYTYYEAGYMTTVEADMKARIRDMFLMLGAFTAMMVAFLLIRAVRFSEGIIKPIKSLCENVKRVGEGEFDILPVEANDYEIQELDEGIQNMAECINSLLENVKEEEKLQHLTELQLIQAQVNPHFLYNTLDTIVWLVEGDLKEQAVEMINSLSVFFRTSLSKGKDVITLEEEIMHTKSYLKIQKSRYRDIMDYDIKIPDGLLAVEVPKLTLQPLAENALYHGVKTKRGKSSIHITGFERGEDIVFEVTDNGSGMTEERLQEVRLSLRTGERVGFGISAVHERIRLYFGAGYGITIESVEGKGTTVRVRIAKKIQQPG